MELQEMKTRLETIINQPAEQMSAADKKYVRECCNALGVEFEPKNTRCKSCYQDAAILCVLEIKKRDAEANAGADTRRYILRPGTDVFFGNTRVNEATLTDELAERLLARGFDPKFFVKCE